MASVSVLVQRFSVVFCAQGVGVEKQSCGVHAHGVAQGECRRERRASKQAEFVPSAMKMRQTRGTAKSKGLWKEGVNSRLRSPTKNITLCLQP